MFVSLLLFAKKLFEIISTEQMHKSKFLYKIKIYEQTPSIIIYLEKKTTFRINKYEDTLFFLLQLIG